jgi:uncharacterized membrane protein YeaQ/YmgE (transglycosylase-associated protein family)
MVTAIAYFILFMFVVGMAAGWLAWVVLGKSKVLMRDRKPNYGLLTVLGVIGSFIGGAAVSLLAGEGFALLPSGMIGSFVGAMAAVAAYSAVKK